MGFGCCQYYDKLLILLIMSVHSNHGPLIALPNSHSRTSLYSNNTDQSDEPVKVNVQAPTHPRKKQSSPKIAPIIVSHERSPKAKQKTKVAQSPSEEKMAPKLPSVKQPNPSIDKSRQKAVSHSFTNDAAERYALFNEKQTGPESKEDGLVRQNLFSMNQSRKERAFQRYGNSQVTPEQKSAPRIIGSSQGSRFLKSQSLAVSRQQKTFKHLIRYFHKHNSIMIEALHRSWEIFQSTERTLNEGPFGLSIYDPLEVIKVKMQSYLERQINMENFQNHKPSPDWTQEQYINYYGNYRKIFIQNTHDEGHHKPYTLKKYKNCVFFGHMHEGKKEKGILHYFSGKCFEGKFKDDQKEFGLQIDEKELYLGKFKKGVRYGEGILKNAEALWVGTFTNGQFSTVGSREVNGNSSLFQNSSKNKNGGSQNKKGFEISHSAIKFFDKDFVVLKKNEGDIFIGSLTDDGEKQGQGLQVFANGDLYLGKYELGNPEGYGEYYWQNGSNYRGQFLSGMRHGRGVWQMINGDSYEGEYMNDKKNGKGVYLWKNGSRYEGNFQNDYRHGYGEMKWQDGRMYKGKWLNGIQKNLLITLEKPQAKNSVSAKGTGNSRPAFRTIQHDNKKRIPLDKLKSLYNPSYQ